MALRIFRISRIQRASEYSQLAADTEAATDDGSRQCFIEDEEKVDDTTIKTASSRIYFYARRFAIAIWSVLSTSAFLTGLYWHINSTAMCRGLDSYWTPVWDDVDPLYRLVKFNGSLDAPSEFRGPPSTEVDAAWSRLDDFGSVALSEEEFLRAGGSLENSKMPNDLGGGYMADIEVLHQMHCLNFVRMAAYSDHYRSIAPEWKDSKHTFAIHLDHCIEMLRINLLCRTDAGVIPFRWIENYQRPLPDFSTMHKCRDWEGVLDWARRRQVVVPKGYQWSVQPGEKVFPRPGWMLPLSSAQDA